MTTLKIHCLIHAPFENEGYIRDWIQQNGHQITYTRLYCNELLPSPDSIDGIIVMGGPMSVNDEKEFPWIQEEKKFILHFIKNDLPVLGICFGAQMIASILGAKIYKANQKEIGWWPIEILKEGIFGQSGEFTTFQWHGETFSLPDHANLFAQSEAIAHQAFSIKNKIIALQFHPEMTPEGIEQLIHNCSEDITEGEFIQTAKEMLSRTNYFEQNRRFLYSILKTLFNNN